MNKQLRGWAAVLACCYAVAAQSAIVEVGKIVVDRLDPKSDNERSGPGANIIAHWETNDEFGKQTVFKKENLRWFQWLSCSDAVTLLTPRPNRPFIDPRQGQNAPGSPTGEGDALPFYDFSYPTQRSATRNQNIMVDGSGEYMRDDPRAARGQKSISYYFYTFVVCIMPDKKLAAMGGFTWGFTVDNIGNNNLTAMSGLRSDQISLGRFTDIHKALGEDFSEYTFQNNKAASPTTQYVFATVPEPGTLIVLMASLALVRRRSRRAR